VASHRGTGRPALPALIGVLVAATPALARAHDAAPVAYDVHAVSPDGTDVAIETNYGLLRRGPDGRWRLLCDDVLGPGAKWFTASPAGTVGVASLDGYARSADGCAFAAAPGSRGPPLRLERLPRAAGPDVILLLTEAAQGGTLLRSDDDGVTFRDVLLDGGDRPTSLGVDTSTEGRAAVLALREDGSWRLHETLDAGVTWRPGPSLAATSPLRIASLGSSGLFLRANMDGRGELLRLGEKGLEAVLFTQEPLIFVTEARSGDLWCASPRELWRSRSGGALGTWERQAEPGDLTCLRNIAGMLYACHEDDARRVVVSVSRDLGERWEELLRFSDLAGPVECGAESDIGRTCNARWPVDALALGAPLSPAEPRPAPPEGCGCGASPVALALLSLSARRRPRDAHARAL